MRWLDPADCLAAQECLRAGNALEAARLLLGSPQRRHRAARRLLLAISGPLVEQAEDAYRRGDVLVAWEMIDYAGHCAELEGQAAALQGEIAQKRAELEKQQEWQDKRLERASAWAQQGRLRSAIGLLEPLADEGEAQRLKLDLEDRLSRFERYVHQTRQYLDQGDLGAAQAQFNRARAINVADPQLVQLEMVLQQMVASRQPKHEADEQPRPIRERSVSFTIGAHALVVSRHEVVIGNLLGESVDVPIQAKIHRRHALLVRDRGRYRGIPYADHEVGVNGDRVADSRELHDGDLVELGTPHCRWVFRLPCAGSNTALLERATPASASIRTRDGRQLSQVVLMANSVKLRPRPPAHLVIPELPCDSVTFRWSAAGLTVEPQGGTVSFDKVPEPALDSPSLVVIPGQLVIRREIDEAELLGRAFAGDKSADELRLRLADGS